MAKMQYGTLPGVAKPISRLVQGVGRAKSLGDEAGFALLDTFFELGCNTFDTARVYGSTDTFLGKWIAARGNRDQIVILGKGAHHNGERQRVTPADIREDLDKSLQDMKLDFIDLYILHRDDPTQPVGPIVETLNEAQKAGKIGAFGGSNWTHQRLAEANAWAAAHDLTPFACTNPNYTLVEQIDEPWANCISIGGPKGEEAVAYYREHKMPVFAWSSLAGGFLSGRITRENKDEAAANFNELVKRCYYSEPNFQRLDRVGELAALKGATVPQIALAYLFSQGLDFHALVSCADGAEFTANVEALDMSLTPAEIAYVELKTDA